MQASVMKMVSKIKGTRKQAGAPNARGQVQACRRAYSNLCLKVLALSKNKDTRKQAGAPNARGQVEACKQAYNNLCLNVLAAPAPHLSADVGMQLSKATTSRVMAGDSRSCNHAYRRRIHKNPKHSHVQRHKPRAALARCMRTKLQSICLCHYFRVLQVFVHA